MHSISDTDILIVDTENLEELPTELPDNLDSSKFGIYNTERVLKKFYLVVFPEEY